jgi:hypothetical protein
MRLQLRENLSPIVQVRPRGDSPGGAKTVNSHGCVGNSLAEQLRIDFGAKVEQDYGNTIYFSCLFVCLRHSFSASKISSAATEIGNVPRPRVTHRHQQLDMLIGSYFGGDLH